jgi:UDP-N-acetylglucosamine--N-acetylmuramyl-(pentapeptide) pyrophosphoryl-undecaprenol N-acetylglucosamine transferase
MNKENYIFTGGGSGGHVLPALTLIKQLKLSNNALFYYIGSHEGIEKSLAAEHELNYTAISTGKLRRYLSVENIKDIFKVLLGLIQAYLFLFKFKRKECIIVATGGFVIVPVVIAAWLQRKKVVIHEQTSRVGLANKLASFFAKRVFVTFPSSRQFFPEQKVAVTGYPLRSEIFEEHLCRYDEDKPLLFITGGGNGSALINHAIEEIRVELLKEFSIVHQVGKKHYDDLKGYETDRYKVFDFIGEEMIDLLKEADVIISRSGAGTVVELMALGKPSVFIPLKIAQKNEQYHNALEAHESLGSIIIEEKDLSRDTLLSAVQSMRNRKSRARTGINPTPVIAALIQEELRS